ncbi:hypothetical protein BH10ACT3_BH10ACT3_03200 [soil metagenome]
MGLAYAALLQLLGESGCEPTEGSSQYGRFAWSAWPPGPTCTFPKNVHGFDEVRGPKPVMSVWFAARGLGGVVCLERLRRSRVSDERS